MSSRRWEANFGWSAVFAFGGPETLSLWLHSVVHEAYRRALIRRFPYAVFYEEEAAVIRTYGGSGGPNWLGW